MKRKDTQYYPDKQLVVTTLSGELDAADVQEWHQSLKSVTGNLGPDTQFKILVDLNGFKASSFEVHKQFRVMVPQLLADYGWYVGYLRMFPEAEICIRSKDNIRCRAAAHVHHDETKITNYATNYSMINEGFFTDPKLAREWIEGIVLH